MKRRTLLASALGSVSLSGCLSTSGPESASPAPVRRTAPRGRLSVEWTREYGPKGREATYTENGSPGLWFEAVVRRPNGGFAFTGDGGGGTYVLATDRNGDADWVHRFQGEAVVATDPYLGPASSRSNGIALHGDGGFVVSGSQPAPMDSPLEDDAEVGWLAAIDDDRELAWHADPVTETASTCRDVVRRGDGSFAFVETQAGDEGPRGWVGVVDGDGDLQTEETYDIEPMDADELPDGDDELVQGFGSLTTTSDEGLVLAGGTAGGGWLVKTDAEGAAAWHSRLEPPHGGLMDVAETPDGDYVVVGGVRTDDPAPDYTVTDEDGQADLSLALIDDAGDVVWQRAYDGGGNEFGRAVVVTEADDVLAVGHQLRNGDRGVFVLRTDLEGAPVLSETYFPTDNQGGTDVTQATDGGFVVTTETTVVKLGGGDPPSESPATASTTGTDGTRRPPSPESATPSSSAGRPTTDRTPTSERTPSLSRTSTDAE